MLKKLATLASCIALAQLAMAQNEDEEVIDYKTVGNWSVRVDPSLGFRCFGFAAYGETTGVRFGAAADGDGYYFNIADVMWRSLKPGELYPISVQFDDYAPWEAQASAVDWGDGLKGLWINVGSDFMVEFAKSDAVVFHYNDEDVAHLELTESGKALAVLAECEQMIEEILAEEGLDPFANAPATPDDTFSVGSPFREDPFANSN